jgi:hypothetical protein
VEHQSRICSNVNVAVVSVNSLPSGSLTISHIAPASSTETGRKVTSSPTNVGLRHRPLTLTSAS